MKLSTYPMGKVLTVGMVREEDRLSIVDGLSSSSDVQLVIDGVSYPVSTVSEYQFAAPSYRRHRVQKRA